MKVLRQGDTGILTQILGCPDQPITRLDRYTKPGTLFRRPEEVEIWVLADGRQVRLGRTNPREDWTVQWRTKKTGRQEPRRRASSLIVEAVRKAPARKMAGSAGPIF